MSRAMISLALLVSLALVPTPRQFPVLGRGIPMASASAPSTGLLTSANLDTANCAVQLSEAVSRPGGGTGGDSFAMAYDRTLDHFYEVTGTGNIEEEAPSTWKSCSTPIASMASMTHVTDWGAITTGGTDSTATCANAPCYIHGISLVDSATHKFVISWASNYASIPLNSNVFAIVHLSGGVVNTDGCYAISGTNSSQPMWGVNSARIPSSFQTTYAASMSGENWALVGGGYTATNGVSVGPSALAIVLPTSGNACNTDFTSPVGTGKVMAMYNTSGSVSSPPTCNPASPFLQAMDCNYSSGILSHPWPFFIANTSYRYNTYANTWNPVPYGSPTHGYAGLEVWTQNWWDDGQSGPVGTVIAAAASTECWGRTTASSVSGTYPTFTMTLASTSCNSSVLSNLRIGDRIYPLTCTSGVGLCDSANAEDHSIVTITAINTSTGVVTYDVSPGNDNEGDARFKLGGDCNPSPSGNCGEALSGGDVEFGAVYYHAATHKTRVILHVVFIDPAQYGQVLTGALATPDLPTYATDVDMTALGMTFRGSNPLPDFNDFDSGGAYRPVSIITDETDHYVFFVFRDAVTSPEQNAVYRFPVIH